jgi:hypothetical protein
MFSKELKSLFKGLLTRFVAFFVRTECSFRSLDLKFGLEVMSRGLALFSFAESRAAEEFGDLCLQMFATSADAGVNGVPGLVGIRQVSDD